MKTSAPSSLQHLANGRERGHSRDPFARIATESLSMCVIPGTPWLRRWDTAMVLRCAAAGTSSQIEAAVPDYA
jgi:hypothetical protein